MDVLKALRKGAQIYGTQRGPVKGTETYNKWLAKYKETMARKGFSQERIKNELQSTHDKLGVLQKEVLRTDLNPEMTAQQKLQQKMRIYKRGQKIGGRFSRLSDAYPEIAAQVSRSYLQTPKQQPPSAQQP